MITRGGGGSRRCCHGGADSKNLDHVEHRNAVRQAAGLQSALNAQAQHLIEFGIINSGADPGAQDVTRTGGPSLSPRVRRVRGVEGGGDVQ